MNCSSAEDHFERFLDAELTPAQATRMLDHVDRCATCRSVLAELRVVDALLLAPRQVELAPNFTFATMAETCALAPAAPCRAPLGAYVVSYLAGAWMLAGAAFVFEPQMMHAVAEALIAIARSVADAVGGLGNMVSRALGHGVTTIGALLGAVLALDATLVVAFGTALSYARPGWAARLRS